jgi:predicted CoA-binding protein
MTSMATIREFLAHDRLAFVGVSRDPKDFSRAVFAALKARGYHPLPVNPLADTIDDEPAYHAVEELPEDVPWALVMTPPEKARDVAEACARRGIGRVWLHRGAGQGAVTDEAIALCRERGIEVVEGECPLMFLADAGWVHRLHGFGRRLAGHYPC